MVEIKSIECNSIEIKSIEHNSTDTSNLNKISEEIINEERNYRELKESIRMMKGQEDKK